MTIEPGLLLGLNYLLLHSDRHRPAIQEHDQQEVVYQRSLWNGLCPASLVTNSSFYLWRPSKLMPKNPRCPPSSHSRPCDILSWFPRSPLRRPFPAIIPFPLITFLDYQRFRATGAQSWTLKNGSIFTSPQDTLRMSSAFNMRKLQSRDDVLFTKATPPMRAHVGRGNDHLAPTICFFFSTLLSFLNWTR